RWRVGELTRTCEALQRKYGFVASQCEQGPSRPDSVITAIGLDRLRQCGIGVVESTARFQCQRQVVQQRRPATGTLDRRGVRLDRISPARLAQRNQPEMMSRVGI